MQRAPQYNDDTKPSDCPNAATLARWEKKAPSALRAGTPADFLPLALETRTHVSTAVLCCHMSRQPQTARGWASAETYPEGLRPIRVNGRLAWPVAGIRAALGVA
jgi:hypothetical protein